MLRSFVVLSALLALTILAAAPHADDPLDDGAAAASVAQPVPTEAQRVKNPVRATEESVERGGKMFSSQCAMCHGGNGDGNGDLAQRLELAMPDFTSEERQTKRTDGELFYILTEGHGRMPGDGDRLPASTKWDMINYVRSLVTKR